MYKSWIGCVISESLHDPTFLNTFRALKFRITYKQLPIDDKGTTGRWHMFWIECTQDQIIKFEQQMKYSWYGHFWKDNSIIVVFAGRSFKLKKDDKHTWTNAIEYGKVQNITEDMLDFAMEIEN